MSRALEERLAQAAARNTAAAPQPPAEDRPLRSVARREDAWSSLTPGKPQTVARIIRDLTDGQPGDYVRAYDDCEKDGEIVQSIETRKDAVLACPIEITPADDSDTAAEIAESIRDIWEAIPARQEALRDLLDAIPLGFALAQIRLSPEPIGGFWRVAAIETIDPAALTFRREMETLDYPRLLTRDYNPYGIDLEPYREVLIFHQRRKRGSCLKSGLMRTLLWYSLFKRFALKDWISFCERYALPLLVGKYPASASKQDKDGLFTALKSLGSDAAALISEGTRIETIEANRTSSSTTFQQFLAMVDEAIVKVVLGQTRTSMGEGGSYALAKVHEQVLGTKTAADTTALAETLNNQLIRRLVLWNYGPGVIDLAPRIQFVYQEPEQRQQEATALRTAVELGLEVPKSHARRVLGIPEPEEGEEVLSPPAGGAAGNPFAEMRRARMEGRPWLR